jgi:hypothetical protein
VNRVPLLAGNLRVQGGIKKIGRERVRQIAAVPP